ncbi:SPFH domain-containing protein [Aestuariivirga sp.]|uniref:SPFH domain-containing protein n=1 Tax=Aestuariivirga sp. TaxID=2650926 RepID=UPI0039E312C9
MEDSTWVTVLIALAVILVLLALGPFRRKDAKPSHSFINEWQTGLLYKKGKFVQEVGPGKYWLFGGRTLYAVPKSEQMLIASGQEVLSQDRLQFKISAVVVYTITAPRKIFEATLGQYNTRLLTDLQLILRELSSSRALEKIIDARAEFDAELLAKVKERMEPHGITI